jgi:hypothetical protein
MIVPDEEATPSITTFRSAAGAETLNSNEASANTDRSSDLIASASPLSTMLRR